MIFIFGFLVIRNLRIQPSLLEVLSLSFPIGIGLLTLILFLSSWIGVPYTKTNLIGIYISLFALLCCSAMFVWSKSGRHKAQSEAASAPEASLGLRMLFYSTLFLFFLVITYLSVTRAYSTWDAIGIWGIKAYGIVKEGTIFAGERWGSHWLTYPLNITLQISIFRLLDGDVLPGSKLIFPMYFISLILGAYRFWKKHVEWKFAALGALLLASLPIVFKHGTIGYANLPFTAYLVIGLLHVLDGI